MSNVTRNNVSKLKIKIPADGCSDEHIAYLQSKLPAGWVVQVSFSTGRCYFLNIATKETTYDFPNSGGSRKSRRRHRRHRKSMKHRKN